MKESYEKGLANRSASNPTLVRVTSWVCAQIKYTEGAEKEIHHRGTENTENQKNRN